MRRQPNFRVIYAVKQVGPRRERSPIADRKRQSIQKLVIDRSKTRFSIRFSMLLGMLGMCVFFWGFGYKMSLYRTHESNFHRIPVAKLMSRNEDPNATESGRLCVAKPVSLQQGPVYTLVILLLSPGIAALLTGWSLRYRSVPKPWCLRFGAFQSAFSLRPPPVLCRL